MGIKYTAKNKRDPKLGEIWRPEIKSKWMLRITGIFDREGKRFVTTEDSTKPSGEGGSYEDEMDIFINNFRPIESTRVVDALCESVKHMRKSL